jgi:hypothetical protein
MGILDQELEKCKEALETVKQSGDKGSIEYHKERVKYWENKIVDRQRKKEV